MAYIHIILFRTPGVKGKYRLWLRILQYFQIHSFRKGVKRLESIQNIKLCLLSVCYHLVLSHVDEIITVARRSNHWSGWNFQRLFITSLRPNSNSRKMNRAVPELWSFEWYCFEMLENVVKWGHFSQFFVSLAIGLWYAVLAIVIAN